MTDDKISALQGTGKIQRHHLGGGLYVEVLASGSKAWRFRHRANGKDTLLGIGKYAETIANENEAAKADRHAVGRYTLAEAQEIAADCREAVRLGQHPHDFLKRKRAGAAALQMTFEEAAAEWLSTKVWKKETHRQRQRQLEEYVYPHIGRLPVRHIRHDEVDHVITATAKQFPAVAVLVRQMLQKIFDDCDRKGLLVKHPAIRPKEIDRPATVHARHITKRDIGGLLLDVMAYPGSWESRAIFRLCWLTLCRTNEALYADWSEIDLVDKVWRIPAPRMKMGEPHIVPLSRQAVALLEKAKAISGGVGYVFRSPKNRRKSLSLGVVWKMFNSIGWLDRISPHGIRSSASTILYSDGKVRGEVIEALLAHRDRNKTRSSYNHADYLAERAKALQWWADLADKLVRAARLERAKASGNKLEEFRTLAGFDFLAEDGEKSEFADVWLE